MHMHLYPREFAFVYMQKRKCSFLRVFACVFRADLIKTQNVFACKIFQHSNTLWVQKLSGCNIYPIYSDRVEYGMYVVGMLLALVWGQYSHCMIYITIATE